MGRVQLGNEHRDQQKNLTRRELDLLQIVVRTRTFSKAPQEAEQSAENMDAGKFEGDVWSTAFDKDRN
jgi:hypothetical protein